MRRYLEIITLDREQTTVLRIHCSIGCFHKSCTFFSVPYYVSEVKPTTCFAVIRERFAIWLKVQLPRAAILDCSSFFPMIDLSLTLFRRLLQCLSCYSKGRIAMNLFFFLLYIYIYIFFFFKWKFNPRPCKQENCGSFERYLKFRMFLKDTWVKRNTFAIRSYRVQRKLMLKGFHNRCRRLVFMVKIFAIFHTRELAVHLIFIAL